jgi:SRSO17 transposase
MGRAGKLWLFSMQGNELMNMEAEQQYLKLLQTLETSPAPLEPSDEETQLDKILAIADWNMGLFLGMKVTEEDKAALGPALRRYLDYCLVGLTSKIKRQCSAINVKGLLSDRISKKADLIAFRYQGNNGVRLMRAFQADPLWDCAEVKQLYQARMLDQFKEPGGMLMVDTIGFVKRGLHTAGVERRYCESLGKTDSCQIGVFIGYAGEKGYGILDASLSLPQSWFGEENESRRFKSDIPDEVVYRTNPQLAFDMVDNARKVRPLSFKWVGCDATMGADLSFRESLPESTHFFSDIHSSQHFRTANQELKTAAELSEDNSIRWEKVLFARGYLKPVPAEAKRCRVTEEDQTEELWLYMLRLSKDEIRYAISNAPEKTTMSELQWAACLRWQILKCYDECKEHLGLNDYASRSYVTWHRHMLHVMMASYFITESRMALK